MERKQQNTNLSFNMKEKINIIGGIAYIKESIFVGEYLFYLSKEVLKKSLQTTSLQGFLT